MAPQRDEKKTLDSDRSEDELPRERAPKPERAWAVKGVMVENGFKNKFLETVKKMMIGKSKDNRRKTKQKYENL